MWQLSHILQRWNLWQIFGIEIKEVKPVTLKFSMPYIIEERIVITLWFKMPGKIVDAIFPGIFTTIYY